MIENCAIKIKNKKKIKTINSKKKKGPGGPFVKNKKSG